MVSPRIGLADEMLIDEVFPVQVPRSLSSTRALEPYFLSMRDSSIGGSVLPGTLMVCNGYRIPTRGLSQAPGRWRYPGPDSPRIYASTVEAPPSRDWGSPCLEVAGSVLAGGSIHLYFLSTTSDG